MSAPRLSPRVGLGDWLAHALCLGSALALLAVAAGLVAVLVDRSMPSIRATGLSFFTTAEWDPNAVAASDEPPLVLDIPGLDLPPLAPTASDVPQLGSLAFLYGTAASSLLAMLLAVPLGVGTAAFLSEVASPRVRTVGATLIVLLAAVPSIVYGFWGLKVVVPLIQRASEALTGNSTSGLGLLPAGVVLGIMILPYVCAVSYDVCRAVPASQREAALALGATRWQTIWTVVLANARPGIVAACVLALGRALGETMAVTMLIGNNAVISLSPFASAATIASVIANELPNALNPLHAAALVELALVLFVGTLALNATAAWLLGRKPAGRRSRIANALSHLTLPLSGLATEAVGGERAAGARARVVNRAMHAVLVGCLLLSVVPLFSILGEVTVRGAAALDWELFAREPKPIFEVGGGIGHAMLGSLMLVTVAALFAVPVGILTAVYLAEYRTGRFGSLVRFTADALNGVPSIVIGIFAYVVVVQYSQAAFGLERSHFHGWAGAFALGVIVLPVVVRASEESLRLVPTHLRHGSHALGATHWQTTVRVVLPAALPGILTGTILSVARVFGETAPLLLTAGTYRYWPTGLDNYVPSLPYVVYDYIQSTDPNQVRQAWGGAFVLLAVVLAMILGGRAFAARHRVKRGFD